MQFTAKTRHIWYSPYKLRPLADVIRGKSATYALNWLMTYKTPRAIPVRKTLQSAIANAYDLQEVAVQDLVIKEIKVDQGPTRKYFKPSAMGRAQTQRKRQSHISVVLEVKKQLKNKEA